MLNELYVDPIEKDYLESNLKGIRFEIDIFVEDANIRIYPYIVTQVKKLINTISWYQSKIYLPDIILEDAILKENQKNHTFNYEILDTLVYKISDLQLEGINVHTGKYHIIAYVERKFKKKKENSRISLAYSYGLN